MRIHSISSDKNSFDTAIEFPYRAKQYVPNMRYRNVNEKYSRRKHWIETNDKGECRYCYATFNDISSEYGKPKREKYYPFVAMVPILAVDGKAAGIQKVYISDMLHHTYIEEMKRKYLFDDKQQKRVDELYEIQKKRFDRSIAS